MLTANETLSPTNKKSISLNPYTPISLNFYNPKFLLSHLEGGLIKKTYAHFLPQYEIESDQNGNFEFNLPASYPQNWKVYATAEFQGSPSPKSTSLSFKVLSWWEWFWRKIKNILLAIFALLKPHWWILVIAFEILLIFLLWRKKPQKPKALTLPPPRKIINYM